MIGDQACACADAPAMNPLEVEVEMQRQRSAHAPSLPDLTDRLRQYGVYEEYQDYKRKYIQWRQGGTAGARGECTENALSASPAAMLGNRQGVTDFDRLYPTATVFKFRFVVGYFEGVFFMQGSLLFSFSTGIAFFRVCGSPYMTAILNFLGGIMFCMGAYCGYVQLINIATEKDEPFRYMVLDWQRVRPCVELVSAVGTMSYLVGALVFQVSAYTATLHSYMELSHANLFLFDHMASMCGSILFVVGGICEVTHNGIGRDGGAASTEPVWWASVFNFIGSCLFVSGSAPGVVHWHGEDARTWTDFNYFVGCVLFGCSSALFLLMWKSNDFGMTLLKQLNLMAKNNAGVRLVRQGSIFALELRRQAVTAMATATKKQFSTRGLIFIVIYCWFSVTTIFTSVIKLGKPADQQSTIELLEKVSMELFVVFAVQVVLLIHSVVLSLPNAQPYRLAVIMCRAGCFFGMIFNTLYILRFLRGGCTYGRLWPDTLNQ